MYTIQLQKVYMKTQPYSIRMGLDLIFHLREYAANNGLRPSEALRHILLCHFEQFHFEEPALEIDNDGNEVLPF